MTEHTPGPWRISGKDGKSSIIAGGGFDLARVRPYPNGSEANARLIAAAPETAAERDQLKAENAELVEALESIAANTCCGPCQEAALVARNAIAKATKETKENVAIFTAAPDLIRVLGKAIPALILLGNYIGNEWHGGGGIESFDRCAIIGEARAILAKAKREAP